MEELFSNQTHILEAIQNLNERLGAIEEKLDDQVIDDVKEMIKSQTMVDEIIVKNSDKIAILFKVNEANQDEIENLKNKGRTKQEDIEETMRKVVSEIECIDEKIKILDTKEKVSIDEIRKCSYHDRGFCRSQAECSFYHPKNSCAQFEEEGVCSKRYCRDRHQRLCKYWKRGFCYRGDLCQFSHRHIKNIFMKYCEKCCNPEVNLYYCNFCEKNFCSKCTLEEAHDENYMATTDITQCKQIHEKMKDNENTTEEFDMSIDNTDEDNTKVENSKCNEHEKEIFFKCTDCKKSFCKNCPSRPINDMCIDCMMNEDC